MLDDMLAKHCRGAVIRKWKSAPQIPHNIDFLAPGRIQIDPTIQSPGTAAEIDSQIFRRQPRQFSLRPAARLPVVVRRRDLIRALAPEDLHNESFQHQTAGFLLVTEAFRLSTSPPRRKTKTEKRSSQGNTTSKMSRF